MVTHTIQGFMLCVDRGPNWLIVQLRPNKKFAADVAYVADELMDVAARHFIYRIVLDLAELRSMPAELVDQLVILQERLLQCDGSLRICGLSAECATKLREVHLDAALPNYSTRQAAVHGGDATALHEALREVLADTIVSDDQIQATAAFARREPCHQ
jgi:anti-anti-sigma regulatory factor